MHAWVTADGAKAIDASWDNQVRCAYWGLDRRHEDTLRRLTDVVNEAIDERGRASWYGSVFGGSFR
ncbi:hypothetical protein A3862_16230 [Methylobacterium sp. XJLW]|jgi:rare lipoprotein A (peptidoglycan hydrolase)|nr:hypothetical protein A3862_16230 [Methylobacterium sp. XJLW]